MKTLQIIVITSICMLLSACRQGDQTLEAVKARYDQLNREAGFVTLNGAPVAQKVGFVANDELLPDSLQLKQIALIRHGEPDLHKAGRFSYQEARNYMERYDTVGILLPDEPFFMVDEEDDILLYTSTLERARATAQYLFGPDRQLMETADFREFERRVDPRKLRIKLPLRYWTVTARLEWMLGIRSKGLESFAEAKNRAKAGAQKLEADSRQHDKIVLVAHGFFNRYMKGYLEDEGWEVVRDGGSDYFATTILAKIEKVPEKYADKGSPAHNKASHSSGSTSSGSTSVSQVDK